MRRVGILFIPNRGVVIANRRRDTPILALMVNISRGWAGLVSMAALERKRTMNKVERCGQITV